LNLGCPSLVWTATCQAMQVVPQSVEPGPQLAVLSRQVASLQALPATEPWRRLALPQGLS